MTTPETARGRTSQPRRTTLDEIRSLAAVPLWSLTEPNAAGLLGVSRDFIYAEARSGELPVIRLGGGGVRPGRVLMAVSALRRLVGDLPPE